ncbi:hypothetical protein ES702_01887 [subsurface metagenome]
MNRRIILLSVASIMVLGTLAYASKINRLDLAELPERAEIIVLAKVLEVNEEGNIDEAEEKKIKILQLFNDSRVHTPETGESYLKITVKVDVNQNLKCNLRLRLNNVDQYTAVELEAGIHNVELLCFGMEGLKNAVDAVRIDAVTFNKKGRGHTEDAKSFELSRTYMPDEFKRRKAIIKNEETSFEDIVSSIGETLLLKHHRPFAAKFEKEIYEVQPKDLVGIDCASSKYRLFRYRARCRDEKAWYIVVDKGKSEAFPIRNTDTYNAFIISPDLSFKDVKEALALAQCYQRICKHSAKQDILWQILEPDKKKSKDPRRQTIKSWFKNNPQVKFHEPKLEKPNGVYMLSYYSWQGLVGIIRHHEFELEPNGKVVSYAEERLATRIGNWSIH